MLGAYQWNASPVTDVQMLTVNNASEVRIAAMRTEDIHQHYDCVWNFHTVARARRDGLRGHGTWADWYCNYSIVRRVDSMLHR